MTTTWIHRKDELGSDFIITAWILSINLEKEEDVNVQDN